MVANQPVTIGEMRDHVVFARVTDVIDPITKKSVQQYEYSTSEFACIRPIGTQAFYQGFDTEMDVSHTIYTRFRSDAAKYSYIVQRLYLPDTGMQQELRYDILRATVWNGVRIFSRFDVKLSQQQS